MKVSSAFWTSNFWQWQSRFVNVRAEFIKHKVTATDRRWQLSKAAQTMDIAYSIWILTYYATWNQRAWLLKTITTQSLKNISQDENEWRILLTYARVSPLNYYTGTARPAFAKKFVTLTVTLCADLSLCREKSHLWFYTGANEQFWDTYFSSFL